MVRFIIMEKIIRSALIIIIYIPIWLDLLLQYPIPFGKSQMDLHSNMVRFIINIVLKYSVFV